MSHISPIKLGSLYYILYYINVYLLLRVYMGCVDSAKAVI